MAWQPTTQERDLELIVFGALLGNSSIATSALEGLGEYAFYNSDVGLLVERISAALRDGKTLKEDVEFVGWCKRNGIELNGGPIVNSIIKVVKGNGRRRAANRTLHFAKFSKNMGMPDWCEQLKQAIEELRK